MTQDLKRFSKEAVEAQMVEYYKDPRICPECGEIVSFHEGVPVDDRILCWECGKPHFHGIAV